MVVPIYTSVAMQLWHQSLAYTGAALAMHWHLQMWFNAAPGTLAILHTWRRSRATPRAKSHTNSRSCCSPGSACPSLQTSGRPRATPSMNPPIETTRNRPPQEVPNSPVVPPGLLYTYTRIATAVGFARRRAVHALSCKYLVGRSALERCDSPLHKALQNGTSTTGHGRHRPEQDQVIVVRLASTSRGQARRGDCTRGATLLLRVDRRGRTTTAKEGARKIRPELASRGSDFGDTDNTERRVPAPLHQTVPVCRAQRG